MKRGEVYQWGLCHVVITGFRDSSLILFVWAEGTAEGRADVVSAVDFCGARKRNSYKNRTRIHKRLIDLRSELDLAIELMEA